MFEKPIEFSFPVNCTDGKHRQLDGTEIPTEATFYTKAVMSLSELANEEQQYLVHDYLECKKRVSTAIAILTLNHETV